MPEYTLQKWWLVGGTSVACSTIYTTHVWLVVCLTIYFTNTEALDEHPRSRVNGQQRRQTKEEKGKEEDRQKLPERKARSTKLEGAKSDIITLLLSILEQRAPASCTCEMHQYSKYRSLQLCVFSVILSSRS